MPIYLTNTAKKVPLQVQASTDKSHTKALQARRPTNICTKKHFRKHNSERDLAEEQRS